jgi:hypothetical protein
MGKANRCQTESYEVFHDSAHDYKQCIIHCNLYILLFAALQLALNTVIFYAGLFCRDSKGIRPGWQVIDNFDFFNFLRFSMFFSYFNDNQINF